MARLLADVNFPRDTVLGLRAAGHDIVTAREMGLGRTPDPTVLALATADGRAVLTLDKDYFRLHRATPDHAGIVLPTPDGDFQALAARIHYRLAAEGDLTGKLLRVTRPHPSRP